MKPAHDVVELVVLLPLSDRRNTNYIAAMHVRCRIESTGMQY